MKKMIFLSLFLTLFSCSAPSFADNIDAPDIAPGAGAHRALFTELGLADELSFEAFDEAVDGYESATGRTRNLLTLIDFTQPSSEKRLWVIDMVRRIVLFHTWVAHGSGSGEKWATKFSNRNGSHQSSLGLFLTAETFSGKRGYSMMLDGQQAGVNDNARMRGVMVHGAPYVNGSVVASRGYLGRSWGCPALPVELTRPIINTIKNGSVLYIYGHNKEVVG